MGFPNKSELDRVLKKLDKVEGILSLSPDATPREKFRFDICQAFINYKRESGLSQKEFAILLGIDEAKVSKILRHRISEFSTDRLINLCSKLNPNLKLKVG
jgi:predicted XRE-type DNA-binding protein